jgi:hypothetical protein
MTDVDPEACHNTCSTCLGTVPTCSIVGVPCSHGAAMSKQAEVNLLPSAPLSSLPWAKSRHIYLALVVPHLPMRVQGRLANVSVGWVPHPRTDAKKMTHT